MSFRLRRNLRFAAIVSLEGRDTTGMHLYSGLGNFPAYNGVLLLDSGILGYGGNSKTSTVMKCEV